MRLFVLHGLINWFVCHCLMSALPLSSLDCSIPYTWRSVSVLQALATTNGMGPMGGTKHLAERFKTRRVAQTDSEEIEAREKKWRRWRKKRGKEAMA